MITMLSDESLYSPIKGDYLKSLDYAKKLKDSENKKIIFHCFWRVPKEFSRKQLAVLKSIIVNHLEILDTLEINLWSNVDLTDNPFYKEVSEFVKLRIWNIHNEIKDTVLEDCYFLSDKNNIHDDLCYLEGDLFRLLVLNKYGGFYIDMDVLVLRSFLPLNDLEFLYQWGTSGFRGEQFRMNGAIMKLDKNSELSTEFLEILKTIPPSKNSFIWGNEMYSKVQKKEVLALPGVWFNSEWGFEDAKLNPFNKVDKVELFDGAFAWHWHNQWDTNIEEGSKFQVIESTHDSLFKQMKKI